MKVKDYIRNNDRFSKLLGIDLTEVNEGSAKAQMKIKEEHLNGKLQ